jgi:uncharacterized membrane protein YdjX (TVP38/TMEM64 family)
VSKRACEGGVRQRGSEMIFFASKFPLFATDFQVFATHSSHFATHPYTFATELCSLNLKADNPM